MSFALVTTKTHTLDFSIEILSFFFNIYKLTNHAIYWIKYEVYFIFYPLSERECSPNKFVPLIEIDRVLYYATLRQTCNLMTS